MPYLDHEWEIEGEVLEAGTWVPERNWHRWQERAMHVPPSELMWRRDEAAQPPSSGLSDEALAVLAGDIASAQRDAFIYTNMIERLKDDPDNSTADKVVKDMITLGLESATWRTEVGGPPSPESPRPFKKVLDWLFRLVAKVSKFILNCLNFVMTSLPKLGVSAVAVGISVPPSVSFEFAPDLFNNPAAWKRAREFLDNLVAELERDVFSS